MSETHPLSHRFRGFMPVVVDVETGGFHAATDALLELAAVPVTLDPEDGRLKPMPAIHAHIEPFEGAVLNPSALAFTGIDPFNPLRGAEPERDALKRLFGELKRLQKEHHCKRCILVGHNAHFDLGFLNAAVERHSLKNSSPFHPFSVFDTVTLGGMAYGQTVLAKTCESAGIAFSNEEAHSALYDAEKTAALFCDIMNRWPFTTGTA